MTPKVKQQAGRFLGLGRSGQDRALIRFEDLKPGRDVAGVMVEMGNGSLAVDFSFRHKAEIILSVRPVCKRVIFSSIPLGVSTSQHSMWTPRKPATESSTWTSILQHLIVSIEESMPVSDKDKNRQLSM